ncbi:MAG TPA: alpha/beta hydrolase [Flavisolibacter sp.]|nr:alpha/beta hydrolase [Flavisolibacter sp.]
MRTLLFILFSSGFGFGSYAQTTPVSSREEVIYGHKDGLAMTMVVLKPQKSNNRGIINLVSGNWASSLDALDGWVKISQIYVDAGYTVFIVAHGSQPRYSITDAASDLRRAVRFIRFHATGFGISPDHIGIIGGSSGGHLALLAGLDDNQGNPNAKDSVDRVSGKVQAVCCFFPPTDFLNFGQEGFSPVFNKEFLQSMELLGAFAFTEMDTVKKVYVEITDRARVESILKSISPTNLVSSDDPPVLIWHGDADKLVPLQQSQLLQKKMQAAKVPFELKVKQGGDHGWKNMMQDEKEFVKWFDKYLKG